MLSEYRPWLIIPFLTQVFPMLDELLETHTHFLSLLLARKRASLAEGRDDNSFLIRIIGDILVNQVRKKREEIGAFKETRITSLIDQIATTCI